MELTIGDVLDATGATPIVTPADTALDALCAMPCHDVGIDSRWVGQHDLFVALRGSNTDGARFVGDAFARGALAALTVEHPVLDEEQYAARRAICGDAAPFAALVVPDPLASLQQAAAAWRTRHGDVRVVGITGSVGKTTTREAIAAVVGETMPVLVSPRSYNNEIGLPLTILGLERRHRAAVLEMGMYARGEIATLCALAHPSIGVVTMVAPIHLERLGSIEAIAAAKAELVQALPSGGVAVLNGDDARVRAMAAHSSARVVYYGVGDENDWRASDVRDLGLDGMQFTLLRGTWSARIETTIVGRHFVYALLAAAAVAEALEMPRDRIAAALGRVRIGERQRLLQAPDQRLVIDDSWNASPPSVLAALEVLAMVPRRRVAVLGEMLELGAGTDAAHRAVGRRAGEVVDALVAVGAGGAIIADEARRAGLAADAIVVVGTPAEIPAAAAALLHTGDGILVKGSRGLHLEDTVQWLMATH